MMYKIVIGTIALIAMLTGCQANVALSETLPQVSAEAKTLTSIQTYESLDDLVAAFETATASNVRSLIDDEKVYYLPEDNLLDVSIQEVQAAESYFNCIYDDGTMLITNRCEDGYRALKHMTANNPDVFSKKQIDGIEYYYTVEDGVEYYLWIQDDTSLQLNVPVGSNISLGDVTENLEYIYIFNRFSCFRPAFLS